MTGPQDPMKPLREAQEAMQRIRDPNKPLREAQEAMQRIRDPNKPLREAQEAMQRIRDPNKPLREVQKAMERIRDPNKALREAQEAMQRIRDPMKPLREAQEAIETLLRLPLPQALGNVAYAAQREALTPSGREPAFAVDALAGAALDAAQRFGSALEARASEQVESLDTSLELAAQAWAQWVGLIAAWWQLLSLRQRMQLCGQAVGAMAATGGPVAAATTGAPTEVVVIGIVVVICAWVALMTDTKWERPWNRIDEEA